jgi:hypothetical protein
MSSKAIFSHRRANNKNIIIIIILFIFLFITSITALSISLVVIFCLKIFHADIYVTYVNNLIPEWKPCRHEVCSFMLE